MSNIYDLPLEERKQRFEEIIESLPTNDPEVEYLYRWAIPEESKEVSDYIESISEPAECPFCLELESLFWHKDNPEVSTAVKEVYIDLDRTLNVEISGYEFDCITIPIDYCPKCGRRLE